MTAFLIAPPDVCVLVRLLKWVCKRGGEGLPEEASNAEIRKAASRVQTVAIRRSGPA
jgi:hypothetical protein